ncbi:MAG: alkaline phosphatase family protein [Spirochaetales bacterium]|nr:alkaline phosphatase family protein [Spirochaetales bacterium]
MKRNLLVLFLSSIILSCAGIIPVQRDYIDGWIDSENSYKEHLPHTVISRSIENFLSDDSIVLKKKVLFIGYDGVRTDAIAKSEIKAVPYIAGFPAGGLFYSHVGGVSGQLQRTDSGPGWATILTGVWADSHGFVRNSVASKSSDASSFLKKAKLLDKNYVVASLVKWGTINDNILGDEKDIIDFQYNAKSDEDLFERSKKLLSDSDPDVVFIAFDDPDAAGHSSGFSPFSNKYLEQISLTDSYAYELLKIVEAREAYANEKWLIIISTDHGGSGTGHGGQSDHERNVWFVISEKSYVY